MSTWVEGRGRRSIHDGDDPQGRPFRQLVGPSFREPRRSRSRLPCLGSWVGGKRNRGGARQSRVDTVLSAQSRIVLNFAHFYVISREVVSSVSASYSPPYPRHLGAPRPRCGAGGRRESQKEANNLCFQERHSISGVLSERGVGSQSCPPPLPANRAFDSQLTVAPAGLWRPRYPALYPRRDSEIRAVSGSRQLGSAMEIRSEWGLPPSSGSS